MIDSHCHLDREPLINNINEVLIRSKNVGIKKLLTICTTLKSFENIKNILKIDEIIYGTFGIHPHETDNNRVSKKLVLEKQDWIFITIIVKKISKLIVLGHILKQL